MNRVHHIGVFLFAFCLPCIGIATPSEAERDLLTFVEFFSANANIEGPVDTRYFMPMGPTAKSEHNLSATLVIPETESKFLGAFSGVSVQMFTTGNRLIPMNRDFVRGSQTHHLNLIVSPGRVWSEPTDNGWSRASFPFVISGRWPDNALHGLATFLFDGEMVSPLVVQISSERSGLEDWGQMPVSLLRGTINDRDRAFVEAEYERELKQRLPTRPLSELAENYGRRGQEALRLWPASELESVSGILVDGVIFLEGCQTQFGPYPYCSEMRHNVFSMTKSLGGLVALLRLAQKYGDQVFDLKVRDFSRISNEGTFAQSINMTTIGEFRYSDWVTNRLATAMDNFLKSQEGPGANIWDMVHEEVFRPVGVFYAPLFHISGQNGDRGSPIFSEGLYPTYHDIAKVALLLQNGGQHGGEQLLSQSKIWEALYRTDIRGELAPEAPSPGVSYHMSFWQVPVVLDNCTINVSLMSGVGGKIAVLLPSGTAAFYIRNGRGTNYVQELSVAADALRPECN